MKHTLEGERHACGDQGASVLSGTSTRVAVRGWNRASLAKGTFFRQAARWWMPWVLVLAGGAGVVGQSMNVPASKPQDLTELSLEQLLESEITPINVLGSHTHLKGGIMVGYRYMYMNMEHNLDGTHEVSVDEVLQDYPVAHTRMTMQMQMVELMYAPSDTLNLMAMVPFRNLSMDHLNRAGEEYTANTSGIGDLNLMALINVYGDPRVKGQRLVVNAGLTVPTGSIDEMDERAGGHHRLEYAMQLGSGTVNLEIGLSYLGESEDWAWGAHALGLLPMGYNDNDYRLGSEYFIDTWVQYKVRDWFGPSARLNWRGWNNIHGADPELDPARNPAFDAQKQAGERLDFLLGLNFYIPNGVLKGNRFSVEGGVPVYQNIDGPNLGLDWLITAGWSYSFH
ncbi:MAG TPA: transporter [Verrucomicrobiota bacterium]|nr:hypothetical protein [Verrucomicrobiales bacterium]HRI13989.1 transporter [Verrucomicrobiota bacterium]